MATIINTVLGEKGGNKRIWIEGEKLFREEFQVGDKYDLEFQDKQVIVRINESGKYTVSRRNRNGKIYPLIDVNVKQLATIFDGVRKLRVLIRKGSILITSHHQQAKVNERVQRLMTKLAENKPLDVASLFHGGGILDKAIHSGFKAAGIKTRISVAVEMESKYLESSLANNPELWDENSVAIESPIQDVNLGRNASGVDVVIAGIPCTGASKAGRTKNKLEFAESHDGAGALFFSFLEFVKALNPALVVLENVPEYQNTASMVVIRSVLTSLGYHLQERILSGNEFGVLENRKRLCVVAISDGIDGFDLAKVDSNRVKESCINEILESISLDSDRWKSFDYLVDKEVRDKAAGKGFARDVLTGAEGHCRTLRKDYAKCGSDDTYIAHPFNSGLSRIFTAIEHCRAKGVPEEAIAGLSDTVAHQILGQSVVFPAFESLAQELGNSLNDFHCGIQRATRLTNSNICSDMTSHDLIAAPVPAASNLLIQSALFH